MGIRKFIAGLLCCAMVVGCGVSSSAEAEKATASYPDLNIVGAMKNVMWKGELGSSIDLDTISKKDGLYGLGPLTDLRGELLVNNGVCYVSTVKDDTSMVVEKRFDVAAPFFVYTNVKTWLTEELPTEVKNIGQLESYLNAKTEGFKRPFALKLTGRAASAAIHVQNLPEGTPVSSPAEAHQGQVNYQLANEDVEILGFFSTEHQGVFTHHDSYLHLHLITADEQWMGHLDALEIGEMKLYLPLQ